MLRLVESLVLDAIHTHTTHTHMRSMFCLDGALPEHPRATGSGGLRGIAPEPHRDLLAAQ